jgi:hypothetical protein
MTEKNAEKLDKVNRTLTGVENALLRRKVERQDATIDGVVDTLNKLADDDIIDFEGDDAGDGDGEETGDAGGDTDTDADQGDGSEGG